MVVVTPEDVERYGDTHALIIKAAMNEGGRFTKSPERFPPDQPREWLNRAEGNLAGKSPFIRWELRRPVFRCTADLRESHQGRANRALR